MSQSVRSVGHRVVSPRLQGDRLVIPDVLRGFAVFAMLVAHAVPLIRTDLGPVVRFGMAQLNDVASPLFALVIGMSAQIVLTRAQPHERWTVILQQALRGGILILLGVWLSTWGSWIAIVLSFLGLLMLVATPLLLLSTRWLIVAAVAAVVVSVPVNALVAAAAGPMAGDAVLGWIALDPHYRLTNLLPFFLAGAVLLRYRLPGGRFLLWALGIGIVAYLLPVVWEQVSGQDRGPSGSYLDTAHDVGLVALSYIGVVWLARLRHPTARRVVDIVFVPFRAVGAVALSVYVVQVALIAWWAHTGIGYLGNELVNWLILVPGMMTAGVLWWWFIGTGPIEWLMGTVTGRYRWWRRPASADRP